ncbi:LacI family DNA-binding transcriptional regulator [Fodinicola acaciae]|uniref:LacI family DNA-binding transcriptional regulator n=1 Tax=Fodinicola acaciae TaxID=2681555 RepID=UPI0013D7AEF4|nr:LacI family DNA-binding transcriptional regulator [Fodinicola acaciae]
MRASLKDVAARAGVSTMTVSNVLNNKASVAPATRERVQAAVAELGYRPSLSARNLARGRSGVVALALPEISIPYFAELAGHMMVEAEKRDWTLAVEQTNYDREREMALLSGGRGHLIDGVLMFPSAVSAEDIPEGGSALPTVLFGNPAGEPVVDHVVIDNAAAGQQATAHLLESGRRRVALIGPSYEPRSRRQSPRVAGYRRALKAAGIAVERDYTEQGGLYSREDGEHAMERLLALKTPPDAVVCLSDLLAMGAMRAIQRSGRRVGDEVAVVGFDDIEDSAYLTPSLTTMRPDKAQLAELAIDALDKRLSDDTATPQVWRARCELVVRDSA